MAWTPTSGGVALAALAAGAADVPEGARVIAERAREHGWNAVTGMADRLRTHGYCAGRQSWVTTLSRSVARLGGQAQGRFLGTLHPNQAGQDAIADEITRSLERRLYPGQGFAPAAQAAARPERGDTGLPAVAVVAIGAGGALLAVALVWLVGRLRRGRAAS